MIAKGFIVIFLIFALLNFIITLHNVFTRKYSSMVGPFGGGFGCIGLLLTPNLRPYAWLPLILDLGTLAFVIAAPRIIREELQTSRFNLLREYVARREGTKVIRLRLYKNSVFIIEQKFQRVMPDAHGSSPVELSTIGEWRQQEGGITLTIGSMTGTFHHDGLYSLQQVEGFGDWEKMVASPSRV